MSDFDLDTAIAAAPDTHGAEQDTEPSPARVARKISRKAVSLSALADSLAGGGAQAGADMAVSRKSATDVAEEGFSGGGSEIPHRAEMESSFGRDFSGVKAYSDGPARKASSELGAEAYAAGNQVAFNTPNPDKATVAHELTHVLQHTGGIARKGGESTDPEGIETSGEDQADEVEAAVKSGKKAKDVLEPKAADDGEEETDAVGTGDGAEMASAPKAKAAGAGPALKQRPALDKGSDFAMGMTFSTSGLEKSYEYTVWDKELPPIPIAAVPGLFVKIEPSVKVKATGGVDWKKKSLKAGLVVEGGVGVGLAYGAPSVAELYGQMEAKATGGFEYEKEPNSWSLDGAIGLSTNFKVGVKLGGGILDYGFEFGKVELGKLTGLSWKNGSFDRGAVGWEWGPKPKEFFAAIKAAIGKAKALMSAGAAVAKKGWEAAKTGANAVYNAGAAAVNWVTSW